MIVIGITGTLGAGKGTIVDFLVREKHFKHLSVRQYIVQEIERRGMPVNRDSMVVVANSLRAAHSPSFIVDELYEEALSTGAPCIIESIRTPGEVLSLQRKGRFILLAVDADPEIRYRRITQRNSETDNISFDTFVQNEQREMDSTDAHRQNIRKCMQMAEFTFLNNGSVEALEAEVGKAVSRYLE